MARFAQVAIAIGALGLILALMGLFPRATGVIATEGIGVVQVLMLLVGYFLLIHAGIVYVKLMFYLGVAPNLTQSVGLRLAWTGLLFATLAGMADFLGFGSHQRGLATDIFLGELQAFGIIASFLISAAGVALYALGGVSGDEPVPDEVTAHQQAEPKG